MSKRNPILVIGGGISGITSALELAETGLEVVLIEKEPYLGGNVSRFNNYFPKLCPPACGLEINYRRIRTNPRISYYTGAEVTSISGTEGSFQVELTVKARLINNHCTSCGKCAEVCPVLRSPAPGIEKEQKAAYIPGGLAFPMKYSIDEGVCEKEACGECEKVCEYDAIRLSAQAESIEIQIDSIILATGWRPYDASRIENYSYSSEPDVVTNVEFEHLLAACTKDRQQFTRPSDGKVPNRIAFIQCAGSRDLNHLSYCSAVCCAASLKHALTLAESIPEIESELFFIDLRLSGRNEILLRKAEAASSIQLTKGKVGRIVHNDIEENLILEVEDIMAGTRRMDLFDMVVLATGLEPERIQIPLAVNEFGFYEAIPAPGIFSTATCKRPMDVSSSVKDATGAALKTMKSNGST